MVTLEKNLEIRGVGYKSSATQVKRVNNLCLYERDDEVYEVFFIKQLPAVTIRGVEYPEREAYPNNEDFGLTAWCFKSKQKAEDKFNKLLTNVKKMKK